MPHNTTTTTTTTIAHLVTSKTTSRRKRTSWPLVFASTTSTSRTESATTCSIYLKHIYLHPPSLSAQHLHSQSRLVNFELHQHQPVGHIELGTSPAMQNNLVQLTSRRHQLINNNIRIYSVYVKHVKIFKMSLHFPPGAEPRREATIINNDLAQIQNDLAVRYRRYGELLGNLITHSTKPNSEPNNLLRLLQLTNIGWKMYRQLQHQYVAGGDVQQYRFTHILLGLKYVNWSTTSYMHLPGQTIGNIEQEVNYIKGKKGGKGKKRQKGQRQGPQQLQLLTQLQ